MPALSEEYQIHNSEFSISLFQKDSRHLESFLAPESVDLIISGPPYWQEIIYGSHEAQLSNLTDYHAFMKQLGLVWQSCERVLKPGSILALWLHDFYSNNIDNDFPKLIPFHSDILDTMPSTLELRHIGIWDRYLAEHPKELPQHPISQRMQYIIVFQKTGRHPEYPEIINHGLQRLYWHPVSTYKTHPKIAGSSALFRYARKFLRLIPRGLQTQIKSMSKNIMQDNYMFKNYLSECPPEIANTLINIFTKKGSVVLDPFMGSGTSLIQAARLKRSSIGVDIEKSAIDATQKKLLKYGFLAQK